MKYETTAAIVMRIFGYKLNPATQTRWVQGTNQYGRKLNHVKIGGKIMTTEDDVMAFLKGDGEPAPEKSAQPKTRSEAARKKASDSANATLDAMGI